MRILYDLSRVSDSKTFRYDARLISVVNIGLIVFLAISSITVFSGVKSHLADYLQTLPLLLRWCVLAGGYLFGALSLDVINCIACGYVVSALLRKDFDLSGRILIAFCVVLSFGLTWYSFSMSQNSAVVLGNDIEQTNTINDAKDLKMVDSTYQNEVDRVNRDYNAKFDRLKGHYETIIARVGESYQKQVESLRTQISDLRGNSDKTDYLYVNKRIDRIQRKIASLETAKRTEMDPVLVEYQQAIADLEAERDQVQGGVMDRQQFDRDRRVSVTDEHNEKAENEGTVFTGLLSGLAAYSIFVVLLLTVIQVVLYHRNEIEPKPILSNFDFNQNWVLEVLGYPFAWVRNHAVNKVRILYERLPEIRRPEYERQVYDASSIDQQIGSVVFTDQDGDEIGAVMPVSQNHQSGENISIIMDTDTNRQSHRVKGQQYECANPGCSNTFTARTYNHSFCCQGCQMDYHASKHQGNRFDPAKYKTRNRGKLNVKK